MTTAAQSAPPRVISPERKPSIWSVGWATFLGYVLALVILGGAGLLLYLTGFVGTTATAGADPHGFLGWPFYRTDWASVLANGTAAAVAVGLTAATVHHFVAQRIGAPVSRFWVAVSVLATGYVPFASLPGLLPLKGLFALVATALLVRVLAFREGPAGLLGARAGRRGPRATLPLAAAALVFTLGYGALHPLWFTTAAVAPTNGRELSSRSVHRFGAGDGKLAYTFGLRNVGNVGATLSSISAPAGSALAVTGYRVGAQPGGNQLSARLPGRSERWIALELRATCSGSSSTVLRQVTIRYDVAGIGQSQDVPLIPAPAARCR